MDNLTNVLGMIYAEEHRGMLRADRNRISVIATTAKESPSLFLSRFFAPASRRAGAYTTTEIARETQVQVAVVWSALQVGRSRGLVELANGRWRWSR